MQETVKPKLYILRREPSGGGAERSAARYCQVFGADWEVSYVCAGDTLEGHSIAGTSGSSWRKSIAYAKSINRLLEKFPADVVLSLERGVNCDLYRAGDGVHQKWVDIHHGSSMKRFFNPLHWVLPRLEAHTLKTAQVVIANSEMVKFDLQDYYPQHSEKVEVIYNGFDPEVFYPPQAERRHLRDALDLPHATSMILFVGGGWERKGLAETIRFTAQACAILKNPKAFPLLVVVGKGNKGDYKGLLKKHKLWERTVFIPEADNIADYYRAADVFVLPTQYDPFSNACLEALACGCPVITTEANGAAEVINHEETGFILDAEGIDPTRKAVSWWLRKNAVPSEVAESVAHLTQESEAARLRELFEQVRSAK